METTRPPGFPGNPPARMPRAPTPARSPPPRPLRGGDVAFRPPHDVGPRTQCMSGLHHAAYALPVNASRPGSPQAHASLGSGWWPTLAGWGWIPTGFRTRFRRSHHGILSSLTGLSRHTRCCMKTFYGCVATFQQRQESDWSSRPGSVSCRHLEQVVDELNLSPHIRTAHPPRLPLPDHVHGLVALDRSPRRVLAPFAVDQAADLCSCGHENDDSAAGLVCMSWTAPGTRTTATWNA